PSGRPPPSRLASRVAARSRYARGNTGYLWFPFGPKMLLPAGKNAGGETTMRAPLALAAAAVMALGAGTALAQEPLTFASSLGAVAIHAVGHGSLRIEVADLVVHVDPWSNVAD